MKTAMMLLVRYDGRPIIPLEEVRADFFSSLSPATFLRKLSDGEIPLPVVRLDSGPKGPKHIHVEDLAGYIDQCREDAKKELEALGIRARPW